MVNKIDLEYKKLSFEQLQWERKLIKYNNKFV